MEQILGNVAELAPKIVTVFFILLLAARINELLEKIPMPAAVKYHGIMRAVRFVGAYVLSVAICIMVVLFCDAIFT